MNEANLQTGAQRALRYTFASPVHRHSDLQTNERMLYTSTPPTPP